MVDSGIGALIQQRGGVGAHQQRRHQILKHRAAPREQYFFAVLGAGEGTAQVQPVALGYITLGNCHQAGNTRFGSQQVVVIGIQPAIIQIVANVKNLPVRVEEKVKLHLVDIRIGLMGSGRQIAEQHSGRILSGAKRVGKGCAPLVGCLKRFRWAKLRHQRLDLV